MRPGEREERTDEPAGLGPILDSLLHERVLRSGVAIGRLALRWPEVVGERLARESAPTALHAGLLVVRVSSSAWAVQLRFLAEEIRGRANAALGSDAVTGLKVTVDRS